AWTSRSGRRLLHRRPGIRERTGGPGRPRSQRREPVALRRQRREQRSLGLPRGAERPDPCRPTTLGRVAPGQRDRRPESPVRPERRRGRRWNRHHHRAPRRPGRDSGRHWQVRHAF
ncbi:MAG: hypothetical protein P8X46_08210, partial [Nitrospirales bacterium]